VSKVLGQSFVNREPLGSNSYAPRPAELFKLRTPIVYFSCCTYF
jgi:hypothetical protein